MPDVHHLGRALREPLTPIVPPASLEAHVLAAVVAEGRLAVALPARREPRRRRSPLVLAFASLGALVVSVGLVGGLGGGRESPGTLELATVLVSPSGAAEASIAVRKTGIGRVVDLRSESLPILAEGRVLRAVVRQAGRSRRSTEPHLGGHLPPGRERAVARQLRGRGRPGPLSGRHRHGRAGRRRSAAEQHRGSPHPQPLGVACTGDPGRDPVASRRPRPLARRRPDGDGGDHGRRGDRSADRRLPRRAPREG